jgi:1,4-alpha-glucan branching enzyme
METRMSNASGAFTFVLHSHLPYARQAGMWPHGEEWVHEAIAETYVPLLNALYDLVEEGVDYRITISVTPILAEQLADPLIQEHFLTYAEERAAWAAADIGRFEDADDPEMKQLAIYYHHWYSRMLSSFRDRFQSDVIGALGKLQEDGYVEVSTSAATHGYLPLLARDSSRIHPRGKSNVQASSRSWRPRGFASSSRKRIRSRGAIPLARRPARRSASTGPSPGATPSN